MAVSVKLDDNLKGRLQTLAEQQQRTPHWIMREAIREYVERAERRRSFIQEALDARDDFERTGLHITGEELFAWMETWGTPDEKEAPECHT